MNRRVIETCMVFAPLTALGAIKPEAIPDLRPPRKEVPAPVVEESHRAWVFGGIGAAFILAALCWPRRKPAPPPDPLKVAREKLEALRADIANATTAEVSAIVRRYAVEAFELGGSALTSEEVVSGLALCRSCPEEMTNAAWQFLSGCDVVKFAPGAPPAELPELIGRAEKLIADMETARVDALSTL